MLCARSLEEDIIAMSSTCRLGESSKVTQQRNIMEPTISQPLEDNWNLRIVVVFFFLKLFLSTCDFVLVVCCLFFFGGCCCRSSWISKWILQMWDYRCGSSKAKDTKESTFNKPEHCLQYQISFTWLCSSSCVTCVHYRCLCIFIYIYLCEYIFIYSHVWPHVYD